MREEPVQTRKTAVILYKYCSLGCRDLHYDDPDRETSHESPYNNQGYKKCVLWIGISIYSRYRRTKNKELIRSMSLKYLSFPPFLSYLPSNTATYHPNGEHHRSNSITNPIIHHPRPLCSDTHTAESPGSEMNTRSESRRFHRTSGALSLRSSNGLRNVCL